jgi:pimeloyl-ACP methyl ester carboxylesterase
VSEAVFESVKRLERDGFVLEYGVAGPADGPVLLLLHAIRNTRLLFAGIVPRLAEGYRVIAPDLRGHGSSSRQGPYTFERIAEDIRLLLDAEGVEQTAIAAASFSAVPAQLFAARYPARVSRLVLLDGGFYRLGEMPGFDRAAVVDRLARTRFASLTEAEEQFARRTERTPFRPVWRRANRSGKRTVDTGTNCRPKRLTRIFASTPRLTGPVCSVRWLVPSCCCWPTRRCCRTRRSGGFFGRRLRSTHGWCRRPDAKRSTARFTC